MKAYVSMMYIVLQHGEQVKTASGLHCRTQNPK